MILASLAGIVALLPLLSLHHSAPQSFWLSSDAKDSTDGKDKGKGFEATSLELFASANSVDLSTPRDYGQRMADPSVTAEAAQAGAHLQRGPPRA